MTIPRLLRPEQRVLPDDAPSTNDDGGATPVPPRPSRVPDEDTPALDAVARLSTPSPERIETHVTISAEAWQTLGELVAVLASIAARVGVDEELRWPSALAAVAGFVGGERCRAVAALTFMEGPAPGRGWLLAGVEGAPERAYDFPEATAVHPLFVHAGLLPEGHVGPSEAFAAADDLARTTLARANAAGKVMLDRGDGMERVGDRLRCVAATADGALQRAVAEARMGRRGLARGGSDVVVAPRREGRPLMVFVMALPGGGAAVLARDPEHQGPHVEELLQRLFELTPTEARVAVRVAQGEAPAEVAAVLGIAVATVRTHLKRVFDKTSTTGQAQVVRLVMGEVPPVG